MYSRIDNKRKEWKRMKKKLKRWKERIQEKQKDEVSDKIKQLNADILIEIRKGTVNGIPKYIPFDENAKELACSKLIKSALDRAKENLTIFDESRLYAEDYIVEYDDDDEDDEEDEDESDEEDEEEEEGREQNKIDNRSSTF